MQTEINQRKVLSALCHGAILLSSTIVSIAIPIVILMVNSDPIVKANAIESLNFHLNFFLYGVIFGVLTFVLIGFPLLFLLWVASIVLPIIAIVKVLERPDQPYRYPFIFRLL